MARMSQARASRRWHSRSRRPCRAAAAPAARGHVQRVDGPGRGRARPAVRLPGDADVRRASPKGSGRPISRGCACSAARSADLVNMAMGGGGTTVENSITWSYELALPPGARGPVTIGAAHVRVGGRELASNAVTVRVGAAAPARRRSGAAPARPVSARPVRRRARREQPVSSSASAAFLRAVADKSRAFVGEQVTVTWYLYLAEPQSNFQPVTQPKTDGFWIEDIPSTNPQGRLAFTDRSRAGSTTRSRSSCSGAVPAGARQADGDADGGGGLAGRLLRTRAAPAAPQVRAADDRGGGAAAGGPAGRFPPGNVGQYTLDVGVDRTAVAVGEAVTLTLTVRGIGNVRNVARRPCRRCRLEGLRAQENVVLDARGRAGAQDAEVLMLPEQPGKTTIPALELATFDPAAKRYVRRRASRSAWSAARRRAARRRPRAAGGPPRAPARTSSPPRSGPSAARHAWPRSRRDVPARRRLQVALSRRRWRSSRSRSFGRVRGRLARDTRRTSRRRMRRIVRRRLRAAEAHREAGRAAEFYIEIERVLREVLAASLGGGGQGPAPGRAGATLLRARGMPADDVGARAVRAGGVRRGALLARRRAGRQPAQDAMLERAAALIDTVEKAPLRERGSGVRPALRALALAGLRCWRARQRARRPRRRGLAARQRSLPARRLRRRRRGLRGARPAGRGVGRLASTSATPTFARGRSARRSGRSSARRRLIRTTRTRATTWTRRASWRHGAPAIESRARTRIPRGCGWSAGCRPRRDDLVLRRRSTSASSPSVGAPPGAATSRVRR